MKQKLQLALYFSHSTECWTDNIHCFRIQFLPAILVQNSVNFMGIEIVWFCWRVGFGVWK